MGEQLKNSKTVSSLIWLVSAIIAGVVGAMGLRYGILENEAQALLCREGAGELPCTLRAVLGWSIHYQLIGLGGAVLAVAAWLPRLRILAMPGLLLSTAALVLYNTTFGAIGFIVALLARVR